MMLDMKPTVMETLAPRTVLSRTLRPAQSVPRIVRQLWREGGWLLREKSAVSSKEGMDPSLHQTATSYPMPARAIRT